VPFDAASSVPIEDQKEAAMINIQKCLNSQQADRALALLRAARYPYIYLVRSGFDHIRRDRYSYIESLPCHKITVPYISYQVPYSTGT
jgi:hypothetical protein